MQVLCLEDVKKPLLSQKNIKGRIKFLAEYGKFDSEWFSRVVWSTQSRFQLHADVFEDHKHFSTPHHCLKPTLSGTTLTILSVKIYSQVYPTRLKHLKK